MLILDKVGGATIRRLRTDAGVRLILLGLAAAILSIGMPQLAGVTTAGLPPDDSSYWLHTVFLPGLSVVLLGIAAVSGLAGIVAVETSWQRLPRGGRDLPRLAAWIAVLSGGLILVSGLFLAFVYVGDRGPWTAARIAAIAAAGVSVGLYLFWTSERLHGGGRLGRLALVFGLVSIGVATVTQSVALGKPVLDSAATVVLAVAA
ncbi:MAG TPA: hypothetical protein VLO07_01430, partial [Thermoanaerobaculia bacterium]|nr:hypothetical protein [Thermoanaerobaculia bacterium]